MNLHSLCVAISRHFTWLKPYSKSALLEDTSLVSTLIMLELFESQIVSILTDRAYLSKCLFLN